jgi:DedD protein
MEKEMRKLLLVAVSVGVFLLVTITAAIIMLTPRQEPGFSMSTSFAQGRIQPTEDTTTNNLGPTTAVILPDSNININNGNANIVDIVDRNNGNSVTIQIPQPSAAAVPDNAVVTPTPTRTVTTSVTSTPTVSTPVPAQTPRTTTATQTSTPRTTTPARVATPRTINDYWIQIGAYSAIFRAEDARERLASKGLVSIIENREINGQNLYRVRLGPYTTEREANHWLAIVKTIDGFGDSQVRQTIRTQ